MPHTLEVCPFCRQAFSRNVVAGPTTFVPEQVQCPTCGLDVMPPVPEGHTAHLSDGPSRADGEAIWPERSE